jgi:hypothetical protein
MYHNIKMGRSYRQELKAKVILIFKKFIQQEGTLRTCYSIESSQSLKARIFHEVENPNSRCEGNDVLNL